MLYIRDTSSYLLERETGFSPSLVLKDITHSPDRIHQAIERDIGNSTEFSFVEEKLVQDSKRLITE